ncbi:MAG: hypothetical protein WCV63_03335 [Negativicutes bacterium]|jgi:hypothetical protein
MEKAIAPENRTSFNLYLELFSVVRMKFETSCIDNNALILYVNLLYFANRFRWKPFCTPEIKLLAHCEFGHNIFLKSRQQLKDAHLILHEPSGRYAPTYYMVPVSNNIEQFRKIIAAVPTPD